MCKQYKPVEEFYVSKSRYGGYASRCKPCDNEYTRLRKAGKLAAARAARKGAFDEMSDREFVEYELQERQVDYVPAERLVAADGVHSAKGRTKNRSNKQFWGKRIRSQVKPFE